ncbi:hypothetical protein LCGC14_1774580 [marine sediment metagenome]|uniref:Uncharacterized protein n=1 Tax=marine sediment metagenome TaxID=412755 RepID=A0A0F9GXD2_9ZZZZ
MGYSCTAVASNVLEFMLSDLAKNVGNGTSNGWFNNGCEFFFEQGKENDDGAITGSIYRLLNNQCFRAGSVRIAPDGIIERFGHIPHSLRTITEAHRQAGKFGTLYSLPT